MKILIDFFKKAIEKNVSLENVFFGFLSLIFLRVFVEKFLAVSRETDIYSTILEFVHNVLFFSIIFLIVWIFLAFFLKINPKEMINLFLWGSFLIIFPPVLDMIKTGGEVYWSFYLLSSFDDLISQFLSVFGHLPSGIMYFGTKIVFILAVIMLAIFVLYKTKSFIKTITSALVVYILIFFMCAFPTIFFFVYSIVTGGMRIEDVQGFNVAQFFIGNSKIFGIEAENLSYAFIYRLDFVLYPFLIILLTVIFLMIDKKKVYAVIGNSRWPQVLYHFGLFLVGIAFGVFKNPENFSLNMFSFFAIVTLLLGIFFSWKASVVVNDFYDQKTDVITNPNRPLSGKTIPPEEYRSLGVMFFILALLAGIIVGFKFFFIFFTYQTVAWIYSAEPFRLKRFPIIATLVSSFALILIFFMGYIMLCQDQTTNNIPFGIIILMVIAYTISIPLKDFKDIEGDKADGVKTIPVIFGEKNGRIIVASGIFISFVLSVFLLNEKKLFFWAVIFGIINYIIVVSNKIKPRFLLWSILATAFFYGCILVWVAILSF